MKHGRKKKVTDVSVDEPVLDEEALTEEKVREYLLRRLGKQDIPFPIPL